MLDGGTECEGAQVEHDISHGANRQAASDPVNTPVTDADEQHDQPNEQAGSQSRMSLEHIQAFADHDRFRGGDDRHQDCQENDDRNPLALGGEIRHDAARQLAVGILSVILLFVESFVKTHDSLRESAEMKE